MDKFLNYYVEKFKKLNRSLTAAGRAPHKPILLLTVISWMSDHPSCENDFDKRSLSEYFARIWTMLVVSAHKMDINVPFIHLKTEGFWHIKENNHAYLDSWLFY